MPLRVVIISLALVVPIELTCTSPASSGELVLRCPTGIGNEPGLCSWTEDDGWTQVWSSPNGRDFDYEYLPSGRVVASERLPVHDSLPDVPRLTVVIVPGRPDTILELEALRDAGSYSWAESPEGTLVFCGGRGARDNHCSLWLPKRTLKVPVACVLLDFFPDGDLACVQRSGDNLVIRVLEPPATEHTIPHEFDDWVFDLVAQKADQILLVRGNSVQAYLHQRLVTIADNTWNTFALGSDLFFAVCDGPAGDAGTCYLKTVDERAQVRTLWSADEEMVVDLARRSEDELVLVTNSIRSGDGSQRLMSIDVKSGKCVELWSSRD